MDLKKLTIVTGHYGSGKTNFSVNLALDIASKGHQVTIVDLDIVNPYFRTADFGELFSEKGITLKVSAYANSNLDIPALNLSVKSILDESEYVIIDVGGDDEGAKALGRYAPAILACEDRQMLYVINKYRYLTKEPSETTALMKDIENACGIKCTGIVNNSNLGGETTNETVRASLSFAEAVSKETGLPVVATAGTEQVLNGITDNPYPIDIYVKTLWS